MSGSLSLYLFSLTHSLARYVRIFVAIENQISFVTLSLPNIRMIDRQTDRQTEREREREREKNEISLYRYR